ncbi:MAG TPA: HNH endonuclease signature motif containing protein, partial [Actinomycetales bacterium]|nr:HNH endonuclease signature motif containing protein [Actinomycetales bacterium]
CRFPGCHRPPLMCHAHHLVHWADGGPTSMDNLILLCGHHPRLVHAGPWRLSLTRAGKAHFIPPPGVDRDRLDVARPPPRE